MDTYVNALIEGTNCHQIARASCHLCDLHCTICIALHISYHMHCKNKYADAKFNRIFYCIANACVRCNWCMQCKWCMQWSKLRYLLVVWIVLLTIAL